MSTAASPCPSPTLGPSRPSTHLHELANVININPHTRRPTPPLKSPIFPSEIRSPLTSAFPPGSSSTTTMSTTITTIISESSLKTPITPPAAYTAFLQSAITHASASNTPTTATFEVAVKSPRPYLPDGTKVPLSPMYAEFLKHHFAHAFQSSPARRFRASVSGPSVRDINSSGLNGSSLNPARSNMASRMDPPRSPGVVMLGSAGIINGSTKNKEAILRATGAGAVDRFRSTPASGLSSTPLSSIISPSITLTPDCDGKARAVVVKADGKTEGEKQSPALAKTLSPIAIPSASLSESLSAVPKGSPSLKEERKRCCQEDTDGPTDIKESTVEVFTDGKAAGTGMNLLPAPKGKRRKVE